MFSFLVKNTGLCRKRTFGSIWKPVCATKKKNTNLFAIHKLKLSHNFDLTNQKFKLFPNKFGLITERFDLWTTNFSYQYILHIYCSEHSVCMIPVWFISKALTVTVITGFACGLSACAVKETIQWIYVIIASLTDTLHLSKLSGSLSGQLMRSSDLVSLG